MLRADGGNDTVSRVNDIAKLLDLALFLSSHLADEYLVISAEILTGCDSYAHWCVIVLGSHKNVVSLLKYCCEKMLHRSLSVASGDTDDLKVGTAFKDLLRIAEIIITNNRLNGRVNEICKENEEGRECVVCEKNSIGKSLVKKEIRSCHSCSQKNTEGDRQPFHTGGKNERGLCLLSADARKEKNGKGEGEYYVKTQKIAAADSCKIITEKGNASEKESENIYMRDEKFLPIHFK